MARKEHICKECAGLIESGEKYREITREGDDYRHHTQRICKECWKE